MQTLNPSEMLLVMIAGIFAFGLVSIIMGIFLLIFRSMGRDVRTIAKQTNQLAQKGITNDLAGLVGTASALLTATSEMSKSTRGTGLILIATGLIEIASAAFLLVYIVMGFSL